MSNEAMMNLQEIATLERVNYEATLPITRVTAGVDLFLRDDVIITSSDLFPSLDTNHACLLRTTPETADDLVVEVTEHFQAKGLTAAVFISPACRPNDLPERLLRKGFIRKEEEEVWLVLDLPGFQAPPATPKIPVRQISRAETMTFANTFMAAFEMPTDLAPYMAQLLEPSVGLPGVYHFLAFAGDQPIGTGSLICYQKFGIFGSTGVISSRRGKRAATNLAVAVIEVARQQGVETLFLQTTANTLLERFLRISGFRRAFTRVCYMLPC